MYPDFKELLSLLNANKVKYLVVGGYAVSLHAQPRATGDIDLFVKPSKSNAQSLFKALKEFGAPLSGIKPDNLVRSGEFFRMGHPPQMVDILPELGGVSFDDAWKKRVVVDVDQDLKVFFLDETSLLASKQAARRLKDLEDIEALLRGRKKKFRKKPKM